MVEGGKDKDDDDDNDNHDAGDDLFDISEYFQGVDYRGFVFVLHKEYGLMVLLSTHKKKSKGPHFQTPGGNIEDSDLIEAGMYDSYDTECMVYIACYVM
jgi:hypothetical protein